MNIQIMKKGLYLIVVTVITVHQIKGESKLIGFHMNEYKFYRLCFWSLEQILHFKLTLNKFETLIPSLNQ